MTGATAYTADVPVVDGIPVMEARTNLDGTRRWVSAGAFGWIYAVECSWWGPAPLGVANVIDHHAPGHPGHGKRPEEFLAASSAGQFCIAMQTLGLLPKMPLEELGPYLTEKYGLASLANVAAADHCPADAYAGRCPGVDPDQLMIWQVAVRAAHQGVVAEDILAAVARARALLEVAPTVAHGIRDMRGFGFVPELPLAALRDGDTYVAEVAEPAGRRKVVIGGMASREAIAAFLAGEIVPGLVDYYGDPDSERRFAGGYLT